MHKIHFPCHFRLTFSIKEQDNSEHKYCHTIYAKRQFSKEKKTTQIISKISTVNLTFHYRNWNFSVKLICLIPVIRKNIHFVIIIVNIILLLSIILRTVDCFIILFWNFSKKKKHSSLVYVD